jgi:N-acetylglutamate synthase-like GNAT family acetyltransferase
MKIFIRKASAEDSADIARLSNQLGYAISVSATLQNVENIIRDQRAIILVAFLEQKIVGWIHVFQTTRIESGTFCEIGGLIVDAQYRRKRIGHLLTEHIKSWCISKGVTALRVRCNVKRTEAHQFYFQLGFTENKEQKVFEINLATGV